MQFLIAIVLYGMERKLTPLLKKNLLEKKSEKQNKTKNVTGKSAILFGGQFTGRYI